MSNSIVCPSCHENIEISEVLRSQLTDKIRKELEADINTERLELREAATSLELQREEIESAREKMATEIKAAVEAQKSQLILEAVEKARAEVTIELQDREELVSELQTKLKASQGNELELRKRERELQTQKEELQLEVARTIDLERGKLRLEARQQFEEQHQLKDAEKEKQISDMRKQIDELKRKAEQGSQQTQGEVQELALEQLLAVTFPIDTIEPVAKGVQGGDALQHVHDLNGLKCGGILWESKRTKNWSHKWLEKVRDDQRAVRAGCAVIVSEALPEGMKGFALIEGVWVCSWSCVIGLATALRVGLIEVGKSKLASRGQNEKMELVYNYLSGREFQQRIEGIVEAFVSMQKDLESEKRSMHRIWSKREKQLERALNNTAGLYGDLEGIIGPSMKVIETLSVACLESGDLTSTESY